MAVTKTDRFNLTRWSDDGDPWDRADWDSDNAEVEAKAAKIITGAVAPPAPDADNARTFYHRTDTDQLYYSATGTGWRIVSKPPPAMTITGIGTAITQVGNANLLWRSVRDFTTVMSTGISPGFTLVSGAAGGLRVDAGAAGQRVRLTAHAMCPNNYSSVGGQFGVRFIADPYPGSAAATDGFTTPPDGGQHWATAITEHTFALNAVIYLEIMCKDFDDGDGWGARISAEVMPGYYPA